MQVWHRDYHERDVIQAIDQSVREPVEQAVSESRARLGEGQRTRSGQTNRAVDLVKEALDQARDLTGIPGECVIKETIRQIVINAGVEGAVMVQEVKKDKKRG